MAQGYDLPEFLVGRVEQPKYAKWLERKARNHARRDAKRYKASVSAGQYMAAIHQAVLKSEGRDAYTGQDLQWEKIGSYDNEQSKEGRSLYKAKLALLPTVDHVGSSVGDGFAICGWAVNDAKNDLSLADFVKLCGRVLAHHRSASLAPAE